MWCTNSSKDTMIYSVHYLCRVLSFCCWYFFNSNGIHGAKIFVIKAGVFFHQGIESQYAAQDLNCCFAFCHPSVAPLEACRVCWCCCRCSPTGSQLRKAPTALSQALPEPRLLLQLWLFTDVKPDGSCNRQSPFLFLMKSQRVLLAVWHSHHMLYERKWTCKRL